MGKVWMFFLAFTILNSSSYAQVSEEQTLSRQVEAHVLAMIRCNRVAVGVPAGFASTAGREINILWTNHRYYKTLINPLFITATREALKNKDYDVYSSQEMQSLEKTFQEEEYFPSCADKRDQAIKDILDYIQYMVLNNRVSKGL